MPLSSEAILASQFNSLGGSTALSLADEATVGSLLGVGYGDRGYGVSDIELKSKLPNQPITSSDWLDLMNATWVLSYWTGVPFSYPTVDVGTPINAWHENPVRDVLPLLDEFRFSNDPSRMTLTPNVVTATRAFGWGSSAINASFEVELPSENEMRYFFNTGGDVRLSFRHIDQTLSITPTDFEWTQLLNSLSISFSAHETSQLAGQILGYARPIGYYELTESFQTIFSATNLSAYAASNNDVQVEVKSNYISNDRGAKGRSLQFKITMWADPSILDIISAGTTVNLSHYRATTGISVPAPTCTLIDNL